MTQLAMAQKIVPNIWCARGAEEAGAFYTSAFTNANAVVESRYPETGLLDFQQEFAGEPLTVSLTIGDYRITLINAGDEFRPNTSISFMLNFDPLLFEHSEESARHSLDRLWQALGDGGSVLMPLGEYPFSEHYGWVQDRFGVSWQLMLTDPAGDPRPFILPTMLFGGAAQNMAAEAVSHYLDVFEGVEGGARLGAKVLYAEQHGPASPGAVMFSDFRLGAQWFIAMDAAAEQDTTFGNGISFEVHCEDQAEIDHYWNALSAQPAAEACGWLSDRFGVAWQIVPAHVSELMQRPDAFEHLLQMKKIVIAEL